MELRSTIFLSLLLTFSFVAIAEPLVSSLFFSIFYLVWTVYFFFGVLSWLIILFLWNPKDGEIGSGLRVHNLHPNWVDLQRRYGLQNHCKVLRFERVRGRDHEYRGLGRVNGSGLRLLREGQSRHFQWAWTLLDRPYLCPELDIGRDGSTPRVVL